MTVPNKTTLALMVGENQRLAKTEASDSSPQTFSLTSFSFERYDETQYLNCAAARAESQTLAERLFKEQIVLRNALEGLELRFQVMNVNCFDVRGQFDHAVCLLRLNKLGPSRFLIQTRFYKDNQLICTTSQNGCLVLKEKRSE